ncbi:MAG: RHS repeat-associated core domain-containing protein [Polyangiaceae bacterium]
MSVHAGGKRVRPPPREELVRAYAFHYGLSEATNRTLLTQIEECAADGVCKPPTRFQYKSAEVGFQDRTTGILAPTSMKASPLFLDIDGDGLFELVVPDTDKELTTPDHPLTRWLVAHNGGPAGSSASPLDALKLAFSHDAGTVSEPTQPADPTRIQPELGTVLDYDQDGRNDLLLHDVNGTSVTWQVLIAQPDRSFKRLDTGIARPFPLNETPQPPGLVTRGGSTHLADVNGDHVPDLIQCEDHGATDSGDPSKAVWTLHLWRPAKGAIAAGFDSTGEPIEELATMRCDMGFHTVDLDADGKVDLVVATLHVADDGSEIPAANYEALSRREDGTWESWETKLPVVDTGAVVVFLDVNGDGLPDAVESGAEDGALQTRINTGRAFSTFPMLSLGDKGLGGQDLYLHLATVLDYNGDGRQDILVPMPPDTLDAPGEVPSWVVLQANGGMQATATFTMVDPKIPFEPTLGDAVTLADPRGPRAGDLNGDGAADVLLPLAGEFHLFENQAGEADELVAISDGMNSHDPEDAGFIPNVSITYDHLIDRSITKGLSKDDPGLEDQVYLSHSDAANDCAYPRRCAVGPRRLVSGYRLNDGADHQRQFAVRYRDGRAHQLGGGFLGFGERILVDQDTGAHTVSFYDNVTFDDKHGVFPFASQIRKEWRLSPGLATEPDPDKIEMSFLDVAPTQVPSQGDKTYFTLPTSARLRRAQGTFSAGNSGPGKGVEAYARDVEQGGGGVTWLRDTTAKTTDFDDYGHIRSEQISTLGVDATLKIDRTYKNDTDRWVLGQLQAQKECSAAAGQSQCRTMTRTTTDYGEVATESIRSGDNSPDVKLDVVYGRDGFGNITTITADDAFGHHRTSTVVYGPEGIFPHEHINAEKHTTFTEVEPSTGLLTSYTDPNGLVTRWNHDGFGRLTKETHPDGTTTILTLTRTKDGGLNKDAWRVRQRTVTTGGDDEEVEWDSAGRELRRWWHGAAPQGANTPPRLMQEAVYDPWNGKIARRSVPVAETTDESALLFDVYEYDALGRVVRHTTPWDAVTETSYDGLSVTVTEPLGHVTTAQLDALGRRVAVTDAAQGVTSYVYGPFGALFSVTDPAGAVTKTWHDAMGRVRKAEDPDRGITTLVHDGFGDLLSSTDALGRTVTFEPDGLGRTKTRIDQLGADVATTTWTWDTAEHGIGKLEAVESPDGIKTYTYNALGQMETLSLDVTGESETFVGKLHYDAFGRVDRLTYPKPAGMPDFVVAQEHDPYGHVLQVRDANSGVAYWQLTEVDSAGRYRRETFGNAVTATERAYDDAKQRLTSLVTTSGATKVQSLAYEYDALLDLTRRTDKLQATHTTERFRYDALERLTCAYFSVAEDPSAPCDAGYGYAADGNLTFKSDVGVLDYGDSGHPHAVTGADGGSYGYDAAGNQITRPGGVSVSYTPFDLPRTITEGASTVTFGYDGDEQRIRKTTPAAETLYFGGWYERVTPMGAGPTEHRYYVRSPERVVAVVTRGGAKPGVAYVHADHLGSVDAVTDATGKVVERRSYDAFGQRRNPEWGSPPPASFTNATTLGFTGHEDDGEVGLVNMKGRVYDPKLGRFLTTDPIVSDIGFGQAFNPYSYVLNNPLRYTDPSGWDGEPPRPPILPVREKVITHPDGSVDVNLDYGGREKPKDPPTDADKSNTGQVGLNAGSKDTDTTGLPPPPPSEPPPRPEPPPPEEPPEGWSQNPYVQIIGGFWAGIGLGIVPFAGAGEQFLEGSGVLDHGTPASQRGLAVGQIVGGIFSMVGGITGDVLGGVATVTGIGALIGVPAMVVSTTLVVGGAANVMAGLRGLTQSMSSGSGGSNSTGGKKIANEELKAPPAKRGVAPTGKDGNPVELHHRGQAPDSPLDEMTRTEHRGEGNFTKNHTNTGQEPSKIDRAAWKKEQRSYWNEEWDSGRFENED